VIAGGRYQRVLVSRVPQGSAKHKAQNDGRERCWSNVTAMGNVPDPAQPQAATTAMAAPQNTSVARSGPLAIDVERTATEASTPTPATAAAPAPAALPDTTYADEDDD
jgi:hypothetical protein